MGSQPHHKMNSEEEDTRIFSKDKWPIPLRDVKFLNVNQGQLSFGPSCPTFLVSPTAIAYDTNRCNAEILHLNDLLVIQTLSDTLIKAKGYTETDLSRIGWYVFAEGETQSYPFALLKAMTNKAGVS